jgi:hypothetical protein
MSDPLRAIEPAPSAVTDAYWTGWLVLYVRVMAVIWMLKGLYHWAMICGFGDGLSSAFELAPVPWKAATMFFAVIDLVAAVGLWLAAAWGGVVWLTAAISMATVEFLFPQIYGGRLIVIALQLLAIGGYFALAILAARERPE